MSSRIITKGCRRPLARHEPVHRAHHLAAAAVGIQVAEGAVLGNPQHPEDGGHALLELRIEHAQARGDLVADRRRVVAALHLEVPAVQLHAGPVAGGAAVGDGGRLDDEAAPGPAAPGELEAEPRLAHAHVAHHRHDLAGARQHRVERFIEAGQ
jgi:hypothetical protein